MLFCDKHFQVEFLKIEKLSKFIGIPIFTIMTTLFLTPIPFTLSYQHFIFHIIFSFIGVLGIWISVRFTIFHFRRLFPKMKFGLRLTLQIITTSILAILITWILDQNYINVIIEKIGFCDDKNDFDMKNLYLTAIIFTFLINTIYESFYLLLRLSETLVETERFKKESIEAQYQNLTSRLNPHFLFNSLNTLTTIVEENPKKAVEYIHELSLVYRYVLNSQKSTWTDLSSEMKFTHSYITLLKMRFEENLKIQLGICAEHMNYFVLPLTIQLLIENAVKHNEISISRPLEIKIYCENDLLIVSNNKQKRNIIPSTTKIGLHNITERYQFLVNKEVIIEDFKDYFTVKIPLVKIVKNVEEHAHNGNDL
jgi:two-component system, LytTR family, sensor kinase